jgi:hypothetical protein
MSNQQDITEGFIADKLREDEEITSKLAYGAESVFVTRAPSTVIGLDIEIINPEWIGRWIEDMKSLPPETDKAEVRITVGNQTVDLTFAEFFKRVGIEWPGEGQ